jgi:hypothetical protein
MADHIIKVNLTQEQHIEIGNRIEDLRAQSAMNSREIDSLIAQNSYLAERISKLQGKLVQGYFEIHPTKA